MAEEAVDKAIAEYGLEPRNICVTTDVYLLGAREWTPTMFIKLIQNYGIQREVRPLIHSAGVKALLYIDEDTYR